MFAQLNRFMSLLVLCGLLTQPAIAAPDGYQTLVVNGDTLVVQMAEPLPAGYQTIVVGDDTLMVQILAEPRLANEPSLAASDDSLSAQTKTIETSLDYWTGRIEQDTTWRDTVYVGGDVTIASGATLTLAPDTQVHFLPYHDDTQGGLDSTQAELIVEGQLHAHAGGIVFRSAATTSLGADWYGIVIKRSGLADVFNAAIRDGLRCLYAETGGLLTVDNIAFANCGKSIEVSQNSTEPPKVREREGGTGIRIVKKLAAGGLGGLVGGGLGATFALMTFGPVDVYFGFQGGTIVGAAVGVNGVGTQDNFRRTLAGSALAGVAVPSALRENPRWKGREGLLAWSVLLSPVVGATIASELWRKPLSAKLHLKPEARRVSVGLVPDPKGGLSAIATLRF